ncbi:MFS transporter [Plantactinospora endophytica]|uniref:MFS transporter n=1 Tax=Plantactinospora endophytica TaxID=673535 RepID=A0ABQ4EB25_9ACTN|nr:MFS transporter [Plantactinospora endophytica]GIG91947.1 MFS transporter [Plantactinospora endophytica]
MSEETRAPERPATFREVFAQREYRAVFAATVLTWTGDYLAKAAVTLLVYQQSESVALSAAAFATSYLPWLVGGPLLTTLADRYPYRTVMVICDLVRLPLYAAIAIDGLDTPVILALLFAATLANPPSQAARSAMLPLLLTGDRLVVALSLHGSAGQAAQVLGYVAGAGIALYSPALALLVNAATFGLSALIIFFGVRHRPAVPPEHGRQHLLRETAAGFALVFGTPVLRAIAILVFCAMLFAIVPEGLAAAWATEFAGAGADRSATQALIMIAAPAGFILGGLLIGRGVRPDLRRSLVRPFAVLAPLAMVPALLNPPPLVVALLAAVAGVAVAGLLPVTNGLFVLSLPHGYRARANGVMNTGVQVMQGVAVLATGVLAERFTIPRVVGLWSVAGVLLMLLLALRWPQSAQFDAAIAQAGRAGVTDGRIASAPAARRSERTPPPNPRPPSSEAGIGAV